jgi:hypothetical protein
LRALGFEPFYFIGRDSDQLAETESGELSSVEHLADLLRAAAPAFAEGLR